jgi:threonyl-tRNA synthetase
LPISEKFTKYAMLIKNKLQLNLFRVSVDNNNTSLSKKIKNLYKKKIPYYVILGHQEEVNKTVTFHETKNSKDKKTVTFSEFIAHLNSKTKSFC